MIDKRKAYEEKMDAQLKEWGAKIDELEAKMEKTAAQGKIDLANRLEEARRSQERARAKFDELKVSAEDRWEELRIGMDKAWDEIKASWDRAFSR